MLIARPNFQTFVILNVSDSRRLNILIKQKLIKKFDIITFFVIIGVDELRWPDCWCANP